VIDWNSALYDPLYSNFGVEAELAGETVTVIDMTAGVEIDAGNALLPTIKPAAMVRAAELTTAGLTAENLPDAILLLNSNEWTVKNVHPKPGPEGKGSGEYLLVLINGAV
jgi:hypothetical protein